MNNDLHNNVPIFTPPFLIFMAVLGAMALGVLLSSVAVLL